MPILLSDTEIAELIAEPKSLPDDYRRRLETRAKRGHRKQQLTVRGDRGSEFTLILRRSLVNPLDFSAILGVRPADAAQLFRLRRHNGRSHEHTNKLEGQTFYGFHVHLATERYQRSGLREDAYAEPTDRYADFATAQRLLLEDCGFRFPYDPNVSLFGDDLP